jgi:hypothetical protein
MKDKSGIVADSSAPTGDQLELGVWIGRHQALASIAERCSVADARSLATIREKKLYCSIGLDWHQFCRRHAGIDHKTADGIIAKLEEFGETYFQLSQIVNVPATQYRALLPAIEDNTLEFEGERIPIDRENAPKLIAAVQTLRGARKKSGEEAPQVPESSLEQRLNQWFAELSIAARGSRTPVRLQVANAILDFTRRLQKLHREL